MSFLLSVAALAAVFVGYMLMARLYRWSRRPGWLDRETVAYFKRMAQGVGIPYQTLINLYLRDCVENRRRLAQELETELLELELIDHASTKVRGVVENTGGGVASDIFLLMLLGISAGIFGLRRLRYR